MEQLEDERHSTSHHTLCSQRGSPAKFHRIIIRQSYAQQNLYRVQHFPLPNSLGQEVNFQLTNEFSHISPIFSKISFYNAKFWNSGNYKYLDISSPDLYRSQNGSPRHILFKWLTTASWYCGLVVRHRVTGIGLQMFMIWHLPEPILVAIIHLPLAVPLKQSWRIWVITVYPKKYAHGFAVLCFLVVMQSFIMNSHEVFIHIHQGCFAGTGAIVRLPQCQWSKPDGYGKISQCITTTKHSKAVTVCIFLGIYCISHESIKNYCMHKTKSKVQQNHGNISCVIPYV